MKTVKVTAVKENAREYDGKSGHLHVHAITLEDSPHTWEYHSIDPKCKHFQVGQSANVELTESQKGQYTNYKIAPVREPKDGGSYQSKDSGIITWLSCFSSVCTAYAQSHEVKDFTTLMDKADSAFVRAMKHSTNA